MLHEVYSKSLAKNMLWWYIPFNTKANLDASNYDLTRSEL